MNQEMSELPPQELNVPNIMAMTARLAQILAQEADLLAEMKISDIEPLQKEKSWLTRALELQLKRINKYPHLRDTIDEEDRLDLLELSELFDTVKHENHRRLLAAKEVNQRIVEAIVETVGEQSRKPTYTEDGQTEQHSDALSVTLNKTI